MKKMAMVLVCVMLLSTLAISTESNATAANPDWYNVSINSCGALNYGLYFVFCTSTDSPAAWTGQRLFLMDGANANSKAMLAAGLTGNANSSGALYMPSGIAAGTYCTGVGAGSVQ
jgi:hypothetical protein